MDLMIHQPLQVAPATKVIDMKRGARELKVVNKVYSPEETSEQAGKIS
jgi:hypothetical protein